MSMVTNTAAEREVLDREIAQAGRVVDLAISKGDAHAAEKALAYRVALIGERTKLTQADHNAGVIIAGSQHEGRHRKTSADRTARLTDLAIHMALCGDDHATMQRWAEKWDIDESQARRDRAELWRHASVNDGRKEAADLCNLALRHVMAVQLELTHHDDPMVALKAAEGLTKSTTALARLHSLGTQKVVDITLRPHQNLPEDTLRERLAALSEGVVIDIPT